MHLDLWIGLTASNYFYSFFANLSINSLVADDKNGIKPLYRSKEWNSEVRKKAKLNKKHNWWNKENAKTQYKSVLFVTPTPGGPWPVS